MTGLGYYRLRAELSTGATLPRRGNRGAGFLTYAVLPDPATRRLPPPERTYFGMQGGFNDHISEVVPLLGVRWMMDGRLSWQRNEPRQAGEFAARPPEAQDADPALQPRRTYGTVADGAERRPWAVLPMHCQVFANPAWARTAKPDGRQVALGDTAWGYAYEDADEVALALAWKDGVLRYEAAIPWRQLGLERAPRAGEALGFALSANDRDRPGQADPSALGLFELKDPARFDIVTLTDGR